MTVAAIFYRPPTGPGTDRELLRRFADRRDDAAFTALVQRYGRLVFATCLRVLSHRADAEDAYQATFLVLARRAGAVRSDEKLAGWLHTVAVRTATEVRRMRDRAKAAPSLALPAPNAPDGDPLETRELAAALDEELAKLPDHYRLAVVLCELNGVSRKAAAADLGIAEGTLSSRLAKARKLLADRLTGRGFAAASAAALTAAATSAAARVPVLPVAFGNTDSIINITILTVADTVVKAMCATKLKAGALVAVFLALTGGVVLTTAAGAGPGDHPAPAKAATPAALVAQLGSRDFAEREAAEKALRELGATSLPAIRAGLKSQNPEVVRRCEKLIGAIHKDDLDRFVAAFQKDKEYTQPFEHPVWKRWAEVVGTTRGCRELFDEMLLVPDAAEVIDAMQRNPETAADVYRAEMLKWHQIAHKRCVCEEPRRRLVITRGYSTGEVTFLAYLATFPGTRTGPDDNGLSEAEYYPIGNLPKVYLKRPGLLDLSGPKGTVVDRVSTTEAEKWRAHRINAPAKWLFLKAVATRTHPQTLEYLLYWSGAIMPEDIIGLARTIFANEKLPAKTRVGCLETFVGDDAVDLLPEVARLQEDKTNYDRFHDGKKGVEYAIQVRDVAVATQLLLHKQDLRDFAFPLIIAENVTDLRQNKSMYHSFADEASREAMHVKARAFLAKAGKPEKRKDSRDPVIQALIEQLGDPSLAKRDAAEKALRALGEKAGRALYSNQGRANPEIAERCDRLWSKLKAAKKEQPKKDDPAEPLVRQLGSRDFAEREAAQKKLKELGAAAFAAVTAGLKSDNPEIVRRCQKLMPTLRAAWLARPESEMWKQFAAITGDTAHAKELFVEMASDPARADVLTADKPADQYAGLIARAMKVLRDGYDEAERLPRSGLAVVTVGWPTRGDATLLFFLGSLPDGKKPVVAERDFWLFSNYVGWAVGTHGTPATLSPEARKLFAAWLTERTDNDSRKVGLDLARTFEIAEALPVARAVLANDKSTLAERTPALYLFGVVGTKSDLDRVRPFLECDTVFHETNYTDDNRKRFPLVTQVRDVAHAVAGKLLGAEPLDLGYELCEKYEKRGAAAFKEDYLLGFTSEDKRKAAYANVQKLLAKVPVPKENAPAKPKKLPRADPPSAELRAELSGPSVVCTEKMVGELEARAAALAKEFPAAEDRARVYAATAQAIANGRLREDHAKVSAFAEKALALSRDPVTRWKARSLLASAIYISGKEFTASRREQAEILLTGYVELLVQDLPDAEPEWPVMKKLRLPEAGPDGDPAERAAILAERDAQDKAREEVAFVKEQVFGRNVLLAQLRDAYKPVPGRADRTADGVNEFRAMAAEKLTPREVATLIERVLKVK